MRQAGPPVQTAASPGGRDQGWVISHHTSLESSQGDPPPPVCCALVGQRGIPHQRSNCKLEQAVLGSCRRLHIPRLSLSCIVPGRQEAVTSLRSRCHCVQHPSVLQPHRHACIKHNKINNKPMGNPHAWLMNDIGSRSCSRPGCYPIDHNARIQAGCNMTLQ